MMYGPINIRLENISQHYAVFPSFLLLPIMLNQLVTLKSGFLLEKAKIHINKKEFGILKHT